MAEYSSQIALRPAGRGWPRWLAALLVGVLLLLALLIASWFLRACAPVDPSMNLSALETPAPPAPPPPIDPTLALKASLDEAADDEKKLKAELAALQADLRNKLALCKPVEPPKPPPPPPPVAKAPPPPPPLPADRWAQKDLGMLQGCWRLGHDTQGNIGMGGRVRMMRREGRPDLLRGQRKRRAADHRRVPGNRHDYLHGAHHGQVRQRYLAGHDAAGGAMQPHGQRAGMDRPTA